MGTSNAIKHDEGKVRMDLVPPHALWVIAEVMTKGAEKYGAHNWEEGFAWSRLYAAAQRHLNLFWGGWDRDPESHKYHLAHALCDLIMLMEHQLMSLGEDDRTFKGVEDADF